ncbi:MAG TPA: class III lanthionine synthetase LanKC [Actinocrinis sp.]|nr:class III lanthionine synthetase LanKC [Actinocrinis sp.]
MDARYEPFCFADPVFYDAPERWQRTVADFAAAGQPVPAGWRREDRDLWAIYQLDDVRLPVQGWKIHVSATPQNAERVLEKVCGYCFERRIAFKFLRGPAALLMQNSKYAPRGASGKLLTLYPLDEVELERTLTELDAIVGGEPGPYVLSDLRWNAGPLYTRFGAFAEFYHVGADGSRELALRRPDGSMESDRRGPVFSVPDWVKLPACLEPQLAARDAQRFDLPYQIESVLHFSNGGGIYLGKPNDPLAAGGGKVVLKEGRPHSGLDQGGIDAIARLRHEREILDRLRGLECVPEVVEYATAWEHHFLVETFVEGETLNAAFVREYPLVHPSQSAEKIAEYADWVVQIAGRVEQALDAVHGRGIVFGDLHPNNVMLRPDGGVVFLDFELASPVDDYKPPRLGAGGFAAPRSLRGFDVDRYALASLRIWLLMPLVAMMHLDREKAGQLMAAARALFPLPEDYFDTRYLNAETFESVSSAAADSGARTGARVHPATLLNPAGAHDWLALCASLSAGIAAAATPDRADRLFPGDIEQFRHGGHGHSLAYGAAGVLYALHVSGTQVDPEHVDWLVDATWRGAVKPGALIGTHGAAYALDVLGRREEALQLLDRLETAKLTSAGIEDGLLGLAEGLAGIGLVDLHFARSTGESGWRDSALRAADRLAEQLAAQGPRRAERMGEAREGLAHGASGAALFAVRLYEETGDPALLDLAETALRRDLDACRNMADGTVQVTDGDRVLPYLEIGSTGVGIVLRDYLVHRPDSPLAAIEPGIAKSCDVDFVIQPGLFNGRAGLIAYLTRLRDADVDLGDLDVGAVLERQIRRLTWHAVSYRGHLAFPGDQLLRLSTDLASGSAGVLLALGAALGTGPGLPFSATGVGIGVNASAGAGASTNTGTD